MIAHHPTMSSKEGPLSEQHRHSVDALGKHVAHERCPDSLSCLPDTEGRPQHTIPIIIRCAILGSPNERLTVRSIYDTMEQKFPYYRTAGISWKVGLLLSHQYPPFSRMFLTHRSFKRSPHAAIRPAPPVLEPSL